MPKVIAPLTDRKIKTAKAKDKSYKLFDGGGLFLEVRKTGKKYFRYKQGNSTITIGEYPIVTLLDAREWVTKRKKENLGIVSKKFSEACEEFFIKKENELSTKHFSTQKRRVEMYMQNLHSLRIDAITKRDVVQIILNAKSNELKKRVFLLLKQIMKFAYARDYIDANVCDKIELEEFVVKQEVKHLKAITDENEFRELVQVLWGLENIFINVRLGLRFLILTALRSGNIRGMRWEWVDLKNRVVEFPASEMKNKSDFRLPLTDGLVKILDEVGIKDSGIVFHTYSEPNKRLSDIAFNMILRRLGIVNHTTHGFRSSFSTICYKYQHKHGFSSEVIEMQLSHSIGNKVMRAYQRGDFLDERRKLLEWWESFIL